MYFLVDANLTAGYYLPTSLNSEKEKNRIKSAFSYIKRNRSNHFIYIPNFCIAETFNVFAKYSFGKWNYHLKKKKTIDTRAYNSIVKKFEKDIHNGSFLYHYELNRYHLLNAGFVSPIDHHYRYSKGVKYRVKPMSTFDHLIIAMGMELVNIHGKDNVCVLSSDNRLINILKICQKGVSKKIVEKLKLSEVAERVRGKEFNKNMFPNSLDLKKCSDEDMKKIFGKDFCINKKK